MGPQDAKAFNKSLQQIKALDNIASCKEQFSDLCEKYKNNYSTFITTLLEDKDNYFAFKYIPVDIQKHFYTTNIVESVNSIIETLRYKMGGFFQSKDALYLNIFLSIRSLQQRKWHKGIPMVKANMYALRQLFAQKYNRQPE